MSLLDLKIEPTECKLLNLNCRTENQGKNKVVPAADIKVEFSAHADILDKFSPGLKDQLFTKDMAGPVPRDTDLSFPVSHAGEMSECNVRIQNGVSDAGVMDFTNTKVNNFKLEPLKGGTVVITCRLQFRPDEAQAGKLYMLQGQKFKISIDPPDLKEIAKRGKKGAGKDAGKADAKAGSASQPGLH